MTWTPIIGRSFTAAAFADYCKTINFSTWKPWFTVCHNTAEPTKANWHDVSGEQRMENLTHEYRDLKDPPWHAGPHLFVADDLIWAFTPLTVPGVHSPSWNGISWGVETVGDFETEPFDDATRDNLISALASLHRLGSLDPYSIRFHKEDPKTTHKGCPGKNMVKADIIARVRAALSAPGSTAAA